MGHSSVYCQISKITITGGRDCVLLPLKQDNEGYHLALLPIYGEYGDYGNIELNDGSNSKEYEELIKKHFKCSLQEFVDRLVGYESNEYDKEVYKGLSYCWINRQVWDYLISYNEESLMPLELGNRELLEYLDFQYIEDVSKKKLSVKVDNKRFKYHYVKDNFSVYSDGCWIHNKNNEGIYDLISGKDSRYCQALIHYVDLDFSKLKYLKDKRKIELVDLYSIEKIINSGLYTPFGFDIELIKYTGYKNLLTYERKAWYEECVQESIKNNNRMVKYYKKRLKRVNETSIDVMEDIVKDTLTFHSELVKVKRLVYNIYPGAYELRPATAYSPQDGEFDKHQKLLEKFAEINKTYIYSDEDDEN